MMFVDYVFTLLGDGSVQMDKELTPEMLEVSEGDRFIVQMFNGAVVFRKVPRPVPRPPESAVSNNG